MRTKTETAKKKTSRISSARTNAKPTAMKESALSASRATISTGEIYANPTPKTAQLLTKPEDADNATRVSMSDRTQFVKNYQRTAREPTDRVNAESVQKNSTLLTARRDLHARNFLKTVREPTEMESVVHVTMVSIETETESARSYPKIVRRPTQEDSAQNVPEILRK